MYVPTRSKGIHFFVADAVFHERDLITHQVQMGSLCKGTLIWTREEVKNPHSFSLSKKCNSARLQD
jgi:hypothetical protein